MTSPIQRRQFLLEWAAAAAALAFPSGVLAQAKPERVNIICTAGTTQLVLTALIERMGWFGSLGLDAKVTNVTDGSKIVAALITGQMDICPTSGFTQVLTAIEKGAPLKIVGGGAIKNFNALCSANPQVKTLKDLEGRTVGVGALGAQLHQSMIALFRKYGVDAAKVRFVNVGASVDVLRAVVARVVDAGASEIWLQKGMGVHLVEHGMLYESLPEFINQAAFVSERTIAQKRPVLVKTLAAYAKAYRYIMSGNSEADFLAASAAAIGKDKADEARDQWRFYRQSQPFAADLVLRDEQIRFMQELNLATGAQKTLLPFAKVADMSLARDALKLV
jgi:ABC-type nitrate/sulfonate/bicarbonate transport system substrate-binding protein